MRFLATGVLAASLALTGAALSYAYTGIRTLLPSGENAPKAGAQLLVQKLDEMKTDPAVCPLVRHTSASRPSQHVWAMALPMVWWMARP